MDHGSSFENADFSLGWPICEAAFDSFANAKSPLESANLRSVTESSEANKRNRVNPTAPFHTPALSAPSEIDWKSVIRRAVRDPSVLASRLELPANWIDLISFNSKPFPLLVTEPFLSRMASGDIHDPLLRQVLPMREEEENQPSGYSMDPVGDKISKVESGVLHKYRGRALLILTGACAIHCRYCFRRHYPYQDEPKSLAAWQPAIEYLRRDASISEVLLSGGDPLMITDDKLDWIINELSLIPHLRRIRLHTRLPILVPNRITEELIVILSRTRLKGTMVLHINHPNEIDQGVEGAVKKLLRMGWPILNQSVLLRGVNDSAATLISLSERLLDAGVLPYYLHQLDPVLGAAHFYVPESDGRRWIEEMKVALPGYAVPRYVRESPGQPSKTWITGDGEAGSL